jgi:hypothetical protein
MKRCCITFLCFLLLGAANGRCQFPLKENPITLDRPVQPWNNFTVVGRKSFIVGKENGISEIWAPPFKILHDLQFKVIRGGRDYVLSLENLARHIWVRPEATTIRYVHSAFSIDATYIAPIESPGAAIILDIKTSENFTILVQFQSDLQPMWPGGLGGQYTYWDEEEKAFVITESRRKYAALFGSPNGEEGTRTPAHALPNAPIQFKIPVKVNGKISIPIVVAASSAGLDSARRDYRTIVRNLAGLYEQTYSHYEQLRRNCLTVKLPDEKLSLALEWAKVALDKGLIENPDLGRGLVAGFGPSGKSARPGFAWYFGGDAYINGWAINNYGGHQTTRQTLEFLIKYQRKDGKMSHEIFQSAGMIPWFEEYPYPYYHADTTPYFIVAMGDYLRHFGDIDFIQNNWNAIEKSYNYCLGTDSNDDGLMDNLKAGLAAVETGKLRTKQTEVDVYLAAIWTKALTSMTGLCEAAGKRELQSECSRRLQKARKTLNQRFWQQDLGQLSFALPTGNDRIDDITPWQTVPLCFDLIESSHANQMMAKIATKDMATDWGVRSLTKGSDKYEYWSYNNGSVWPFMTLFPIWSGFRSHFSFFATQQWQNIADLTFTQQLGAISELFSGDRFQPIEAAVPHQLFSTTPVIVGFTRGILGYEPDVPNHRINIEPHWPRYWQEADVRNLPFGSDKFSISHHHDANRIELVLRRSGNEYVEVDLSYAFEKDETVETMMVNGQAHAFAIEKTARDYHLQSQIPLVDRKMTIVLSGKFMVEKSPYRPELLPGMTGIQGQ